MKSVTAVALFCLLAATSADEGRGSSGGSSRFFTGGFGGFPGNGGFQGGFGGSPGFGGSGGFPGVGGFGGFPGAGGFGGLSPAAAQGPSQCRYWCKTPENQAYCCETNLEPEGPVGTKPLGCPDVRPTCPVGLRSQRPILCSNDYKCFGADKCCFDRCLEEHVCKPPSFFG
ncbi:glycine-rich cell wall structural protein-like [Penaeus japonicus]|uniref:glycine-rich cell wall structural protein-like n=1 Tax=Penaeus japonicus TaxID=27405 RepID=UPI001C70DF9B|nr:glycine-rich cell wall structural protein-like [Penaeus japonicus]